MTMALQCDNDNDNDYSMIGKVSVWFREFYEFISGKGWQAKQATLWIIKFRDNQTGFHLTIFSQTQL